MSLQSISFPQAVPAYIGATGYPVAASPVGAVYFVSSLTSRGDGHGRLIPLGATSPSVTQGNNQGSITDPTNPLKSVFGAAGALSLCKAGRGDLILVLPGHTENLSNNSTYTIPDGVTILGYGYGSARPTFIFTGGTATNITFGGTAFLSNLVFDLTGVANVALGFNVTTPGVQISSCRFIASSATNHATSVLALAASDFVFFNSEVDATGASTGVATGINVTASANRTEIINNFFHGNFSTAALACTNANPLINCLVQNNDFYQTNATAAQPVISIAGAAPSGVFAFNNFFVNATTTGVGSSILGTPTSTLLVWSQNFGYNNVANKGGNLIPAAGAALT